MARPRRVVESQNSASAIASNKSVADKLDDNAKVVIVKPFMANKKTSIENQIYEFDADGKCEVNGKMAKYFLSVPGYSIYGKDSAAESEDKASEDKEAAESEDKTSDGPAVEE